MSDIPVWLHFVLAFISSMGFSVFLNAPKRQVLPCGIVGALGWTTFYVLNTVTSNSPFSNFIASVLVTTMSEYLARRLKKPAILFIIPGIIPLVPGLGMYNTMLYMIQGLYLKAIDSGMEVALVGGAIVLGILIITSFTRTIVNYKKQILNQKK